MIPAMSGIYLHIPFCRQACSYCDFYFVTRQVEKQHFVQQLVQEIESHKNTVHAGETVETIYFGGGTPSQLSPAQVATIMQAIKNTFKADLKEVTFEMNPDDVTREYLQDLADAGITRASMGVQTFDEQLLRFMNRAHNSREALHCLELLAKSDLEVFTIDLIYGNPGQTLAMLRRDIETLLRFHPPHISAYSLTIEPRTRLGRQVKLGRLLPADDDDVANQFMFVIEQLQNAGIHQYEVSNYSLPGKQAVHNSNYWKHRNYLGFGPGAHSFWWDENRTTAQRWENQANLKNYLEGGWKNRYSLEQLSLPELLEERLMLGLRTTEGLSLAELKQHYQFEFSENQRAYLDKLVHQQKAHLDDHLRLSREGLCIADSILLDLITV